MARSSILVIVACLVFATGSASAALTAPQIVDNLNMLTTKSRNLQIPANQISIINGPLIVIGLGPFPQIIAGFADIVQTGTTAYNAMVGTSTLSGSDCQLVANAFRNFVGVHQQLLNILIGKAGLFQVVPLIGVPVAAALRQIEELVDALAYALIDFAEGTCKTDIDQQRQSFAVTAADAVDKYQGLATLNP